MAGTSKPFALAASAKASQKLRDTIMPAQLIWISNVVENLKKFPKYAGQSNVLNAVDSRLLHVIGTSTYQDEHYIADVVSVLLTVRQRRLELAGGCTPDSAVVPAAAWGASLSVEDAAAFLDAVKPSMINAETPVNQRLGCGSDILNVTIYCIRTAVAVARFGIGRVDMPVISVIDESFIDEHVIKALQRALLKYADQCQFKATGDAYLHAVMRLRLPSWILSAAPIGATPFPAASRILSEGANDAIRPLIDGGPAPLLKPISTGHGPAPQMAEAFAVAACLVDEMIGVKKLLVNDALALAPPKDPRPFVTGDFGMLPHHCFGLVHGNQLRISMRPLVAIGYWLERAAPGSLESQLWQVATAPPGVMPPSNPFTKYFD